ncbi:hypothetical protein [Chitiniphilus eburneus]|uniref:hypothetical protein n=1 Tax=Chitiniphilus eburneus TaxID=2571148 RepID=UPI0035CE9691
MTLLLPRATASGMAELQEKAAALIQQAAELEYPVGLQGPLVRILHVMMPTTPTNLSIWNRRRN